MEEEEDYDNEHTEKERDDTNGHIMRTELDPRGKPEKTTSPVKFTCEVCNKVLSCSKNLKRHMMHHTGEYPHFCKICGKGCSKLSELKKHLAIHSGTKGFAVANYLPMHTVEKKLEKTANPSKLTCEICNKEFSCSQNLRRHMMHHTGKFPHFCHVCGKGCSKLSELKKHLAIHSGTKGFAVANDLAMHTVEKPANL